MCINSEPNAVLSSGLGVKINWNSQPMVYQNLWALDAFNFQFYDPKMDFQCGLLLFPGASNDGCDSGQSANITHNIKNRFTRSSRCSSTPSNLNGSRTEAASTGERRMKLRSSRKRLYRVCLIKSRLSCTCFIAKGWAARISWCLYQLFPILWNMTDSLRAGDTYMFTCILLNLI